MKPLALDTETCAWLDRPGWKAPPLVCVSLSDGERAWVVHRSDPGLFPAVRAALARGIVGHHVAFDACVLAAAGFPLDELFQAYADDRITCTMAREKLLDIATGDMARQRKPKGPGYGLDVLCKRRLGVELEKTAWRLRFEELYNVPVAQWPAGAREYAANDALFTHRLHAMQATLPGAENLVDEYRQARGAFWIQLMSTWGTLVDSPRLAALKERYEADFASAGRDLVAAGLARIETKKGVSKLVRSIKAAGARIVEAYARQGKDYPRTDGGAPSLESQTCENSGDPALLRYSEYMALQTKVTKEIPALNHAQIHPYVDSLVETGRPACNSPNLFNLPHEGGFRQCLIPRPGHAFVCADYSGFELSTLAQVCLDLLGYSRLADAINAGLDPHAMIAADISGWAYEKIREVYKAGEAHPDYEQVWAWRQTGKPANFGFPGGLGPDRFVDYAQKQYGVRITRDQAVDLKRVWLGRWTEMPDYFRKINFAVEQHGAVEQLYSGRLRGDVSYCDACNGMFQSLAADIAKDAGFQLSRACYTGALAGDRISNFVYDEFVCEVPEAKAREHATEIERLLVAAARPWLPGVKLGVEVTISRRYKGDYV